MELVKHVSILLHWKMKKLLTGPCQNTWFLFGLQMYFARGYRPTRTLVVSGIVRKLDTVFGILVDKMKVLNILF